MFKVGDKVKRIRNNEPDFGMVIGRTYVIKDFNKSGWLILEEVNSDWNPKNFELVKESNVNPCIKTEEVKVVKTKIVSGYLEVNGLRDGRDKIDLRLFMIGPSTKEGHAYLTCTGSRDQGSVSKEELRKLARQLDEIANVLESQDNGAA